MAVWRRSRPLRRSMRLLRRSSPWVNWRFSGPSVGAGAGAAGRLQAHAAGAALGVVPFALARRAGGDSGSICMGRTSYGLSEDCIDRDGIGLKEMEGWEVVVRVIGRD